METSLEAPPEPPVPVPSPPRDTTSALARDTVRTVGDTFVPDSMDVVRGTRVLFINDGDTHDVLFVGPGAPEDIPRGRGWRATRVFADTGRVGYVCSIHPTMNGVIRVR